MKRGLCYLLVAALAWGACASSISAQDGDQWFTIDKFSGLNLLLDKTQLPKGASLSATNISFGKYGTPSILGGVLSRKTFNSTAGYPILGVGRITDYINDSDRIIVACSTVFWNTYGNSWGNWSKSTATASGFWQSWKDSLRWEDTSGGGRAAEFWRPGWKVEFTIPGPDTQLRIIDYIPDNGHVYFTDGPDTAYGASAANRVLPVTADTTTAVRFVDVEVGRKPMVLCLQAGMEPVLYDGSSLSSMRYFGIADSGYIQNIRVATAASAGETEDSTVCYIVDNTKHGPYGANELFGKGYWLHLPTTFPDSVEADTSFWGRVFPIDSNTIDSVGVAGAEFRIWFRPGLKNQDMPGGSPAVDSTWVKGLKSQRYNILSAPFARELVSEGTDSAWFIGGGRFINLDTGNVDLRSTDHTPHVVEVLADSVYLSDARQYIICAKDPENVSSGWCDTIPIDFSRIVRGPAGSVFPVKTVMPDTSADSILISTSGYNANSADTFKTDNWRLWSLGLPRASDGIVFNGRLYLAGEPEAPNLIAYSDKSETRGQQVGAFPADNFFELPANGDVFTAFALIYNWLVAFQRNHTWILKGDPDEGYTFELALPDEGCIAINSIDNIGNELLYRSEQGMRLFDGNNSRDYAELVRPAIQAIPRTSFKTSQANRNKTATAYDPVTGNTWISAPFGSSASNNGSFIVNSVDGSISYSDEVYGGTVSSFSFLDTLWTVFTHPTKGQIYTQGRGDSTTPVGVDGDSMHVVLQTGWLDFGMPEQLKYASDGMLHVTASAPTTGNRKLITSFFKDYDTTAYYADTANIIGIITGKYYVANTQLRLEPMSEFQWLNVRIDAYGYSVLDVQRFSLRWRPGADVVRDRSTVFRP